MSLYERARMCVCVCACVCIVCACVCVWQALEDTLHICRAYKGPSALLNYEVVVSVRACVRE